VVKKDGVPWDLTGGSATLFLQDPNGVVTSNVGTIATNVATFQATSTTLDESGDWVRQWKLVDALGTVEYQEETSFSVMEVLG
jgi:hypothetical protein